MSLQVKTSDKTIREYLNSLDTIIPTYQRSYEWGADQINDFMEDLYEEADTKEDSSRYFFGPVITNTRESDGRKVEEIIDGQQRLTTSTIFLAVLRDMLARHKNNEEANEVRYIIKNELIGDGSKWHPFRLQQKGDLEDEFISHILKPAINSEDLKKIIYHGPKYAGKGKVNNLLRAYNMILSSLEKRLNGCHACQRMRLCGQFPGGSEGSVQSRDGGHAQPPGGPEGSPSHGRGSVSGTDRQNEGRNPEVHHGELLPDRLHAG